MKKWTVVGLFWLVQVFTDIIRVSLAVTLLTLCMGSMRLITASANSAPLDLAHPSVVASLTSIQNTIGTVSSMLVAIITGLHRGNHRFFRFGPSGGGCNGPGRGHFLCFPGQELRAPFR